MRHLFLIGSLWLAGSVVAQQAPVAQDDLFDAEADTTLTVGAPGVLDNDSDADGDTLTALLVDGPAHGTLALFSDGSFRYTPDAGFLGMDQFSYRAQEAALETFIVDSTQSGLTFHARLRVPIGTESDSDSSSVTGTLTADVTPNAAPFDQIHLTTMDLVLADAMNLRFDFGIFGRLDVDAEADSLQVRLARPGPPGPVQNGLFAQADNELGIAGTVEVDARGGLSTVVTDGPADLDVNAEILLVGEVTQTGDTLRLAMPLNFEGSFDVDGNTVEVTIAGFLVATAPVLPPSLASNTATATLQVGLMGTSVEAAAETPERFALEQNYPNPFNPVTTIAYALPAPGPVSLTVYDVLGRAVAVLVEGSRPAGRHEVVFDAGGLPSGVYIYRLRAGGATAVRRLVVLK